MDDRETVYGEDIEKLDLAKYGLLHLQGKNLLALERSDMSRLLAALGDDDISLNLPIQCTAQNVEEVLAYSECRRCGRCCNPNPLNPKSPGVEVFEEELEAMADCAHTPYQEIRQKTARGNTTPYAFQAVKLGFTRWLPLPCPFYLAEAGCQAYQARAVVCRTYPIIFTGDDTCLSVRTTCDYGKDILVAACEKLKTDDPELEIML